MVFRKNAIALRQKGSSYSGKKKEYVLNIIEKMIISQCRKLGPDPDGVQGY